MCSTQKSLETKIDKDSGLAKLLKVMGAIHDVKERANDVDLDVETMIEMLAYCHQHGTDTTKAEKQLDEARKQWNSLKTAVPKKKDNIVQPREHQAAYSPSPITHSL